MKVLIHHIYEYRKGLRSLVMHTLPARLGEEATRKLRHYGIDYYIHDLGKSHINVFFGAPECVAVIRSICDGKKLKALTPEEDFVLGSMLGYDIRKQCERYLKKRAAEVQRLSRDVPEPCPIHKCA